MLRGIANGMEALHERGIIHRDVKPANIILGVNGPILADFGVVRSSEFPDQTTTGLFWEQFDMRRRSTCLESLTIRL